MRCQYQSITVYNVFTFKVHAAKVEKVDEGSTEKESEEEGRVEEKMAVVECCFVDCKEFGVLPCSYCDYVCCLGHLVGARSGTLKTGPFAGCFYNSVGW